MKQRCPFTGKPLIHYYLLKIVITDRIRINAVNLYLVVPFRLHVLGDLLVLYEILNAENPLHVSCEGLKQLVTNNAKTPNVDL